MAILSANEKDVAFCRRVCLLTVWLQAAVTLLLTIRFLNVWLYIGAGAVLLMMLALVHFGWKHRPVRVTVRVLGAVVWCLGAVFLAYFLLCLWAGWKAVAASFCLDICVICLPLLALLTPGIAVAALRRGVYDRVLLCFTQSLLTGLAALAVFAGVSMPWLWGHTAVLYGWFGLSVLALAMVWLCALQRPRAAEPQPEQDYHIL